MSKDLPPTESSIDYLLRSITRRRFLGLSAAAVASTSVLGTLAACGGGGSGTASSTSPGATASVAPFDAAKVGGPVAFLGWQGYEDKSVIGSWAKQAGVSVKSSYIAANDDIITKLKAGGIGQYDVATPFIAYVPSLIKLDLVQPIPLDGLPNFSELFPIFQQPSVEGIAAPQGSAYTVPLIWAAFTLLYLPDKLPSPPASWTDLLDPKFKGKVIMYDDPYSQIVVWAKAIGVLESGGSLTQSQLNQVRDSLIELKKNARAIVPNYAEMVDLFARGEGWVATSGWDAVISMAAPKKTKVASTIPNEGTFSWTDTYVLVKDAPHRDSGIALINEVISPEAQQKFAPFLVSGLTNKTAADALPADMRSLYPYDTIGEYFAKAPIAGVPPLEKVGDVTTLQDWQQAWAEVKQA